MLSLSIHQRSRFWMKTISDWWEDCVKRHRALNAVLQLHSRAKQEIQRITDEAGGPQAAALLLRRMAALDLDPNEVAQVEPSAFRELVRNCPPCSNRRRCLRDLTHNASNPAWEQYCPNAGTLLALDVLPWASRREW